MNNILDLGCGNRKRPGAVGIDVNPRSAAEVVHDLNDFPYTFPDSEFDEIYVDNVLEHLDDVIKVLEEIHPTGNQGALQLLFVPYFRSRTASIDPTHRDFSSSIRDRMLMLIVRFISNILRVSFVSISKNI